MRLYVPPYFAAGVQHTTSISGPIELWGRSTIVVNNAYSGGARGDAISTPEETWDRAFVGGLKSIFRAAKYAVPHLIAAGGGARVNISSVHGLLVAPGYAMYETVKPAVIGLTRQLAAEYGPSGVRVNAICPGHIVTERSSIRWEAHPDGLRFFEQQYPLRRTGTPLDIANAVVSYPRARPLSSPATPWSSMAA